jgi:aryl-alcohol dehydrogenase-like predicted oxidoreductase
MIPMETRLLGRSGLRVPVLGFGAGTFGGKGPLFSAWGDTGVEQARGLVDLCLEAGANFFDTADVYSDGASEEILGAALAGRRERALISTKTGLRLGDGPNDAGASRLRLLRAVDASLRRLRTDYIGPSCLTTVTQTLHTRGRSARGAFFVSAQSP